MTRAAIWPLYAGHVTIDQMREGVACAIRRSCQKTFAAVACSYAAANHPILLGDDRITTARWSVCVACGTPQQKLIAIAGNGQVIAIPPSRRIPRTVGWRGAYRGRRGLKDGATVGGAGNIVAIGLPAQKIRRK